MKLPSKIVVLAIAIKIGLFRAIGFLLSPLPILKCLCPICKSKARLDFRNKRFQIARCTNCRHAFALGDTSSEKLSTLYSDWSYWTLDRHHQQIHDVGPGPHWDIYLADRLETLQKMVDLPTSVSNELTAPRVLEIGSSEGALLNRLAEMGFSVLGCEVNRAVVEKGAKFYSRVPVLIGDFLELSFPPEPFNFICAFHTLEHLAHPVEVLERCFKMMKPGGKVILEVPFGIEEYLNVDHLHFFTETSLRLLLSKRFSSIRIEENQYTTANGVVCGSYLASAIKTL